jgi:hypothetical protein
MWRSVLELAFLVTMALTIGTAELSAPTPAESNETSPCAIGSLPSDIQNQLKLDFGSWKIQQSEDLSKHARMTRGAKPGSTCAGVAVGLFESANRTSYAILLVPIDRPDSGYRFLVFDRKPEQPAYKTTLVEHSGEFGASNHFIRKIPISEFFNEKSKGKFQVQATEGILMVDSSDQEYEADVFFWSKGRFQHQPVDY